MKAFSQPVEPQPPHNIEAEQAFLGALMTDAEVFHATRGILSASDFYEPLHQRIYEAAATLIDSGQSATPVTLKRAFDADPTAKLFGGASYLARLCSAAMGTVVAAEFAQTIHELAARRAIMEAAQWAMEDAASADVSLTCEALIDQYEADLSAIRADFQIRASETDAQAFAARLKDTLTRKMAGEDEGATSFGLSALDEITGPLLPSQLIILAGRPAMGKTTLGWRAIRTACEAGVGVSFHSLEMDQSEIGFRAVSDLSREDGGGIWYSRIGRGEIDPAERARVDELADIMAAWPLEIDERPGQTMPQIRAQARAAGQRFQRQGQRLGLVVIDHLGLVRSTEYRDNRTLQLGRITAEAKEIAKALQVPVLLLCQLSRAVENRDDKRPNLPDLRQSGEIEENADKVLFLYRQHYYEQRAKPDPEDVIETRNWQELCRTLQHQAEVIVGKNRGGPEGTADVWCDMATNSFRDGGR